MARYKPQEIVRRDAVLSRRAGIPILAVHADQEPSRYAGASAKVAAHGIQMLGDIYAQRTAQKKAEKVDADFNEGYALRQQEIIGGADHALPEYVLEDLTEDFRRGYQQADFPHQLNRWENEAAKRLAQLEPDEDPEPLMQEWTNELTQHAVMEDPKTRAGALALMQKSVTAVRDAHRKNTAGELLARQQEALTANIRTSLKEGTPPEEIVNHIRELTNTAEFGYLTKREADRLFSDSVEDALASGEVDIAATVEFLENFKDENGVSFMDGTHGEALRLAAARGAAVQQAQMTEARKDAQVVLERPLRDLARQGRLTDDKVLEVADQLGLTGQERLTFTRHWMNAQEQGVKAIQAEAEKRRKEAAAEALARRNPLWLSNEDARKVLDRRLLDAAGGDETAVISTILGNGEASDEVAEILTTAASWNIVPTFVNNILQRGGYDGADTFATQSALYQQLRAQSPAFASKAAGSKAAVYDDYHAEVVIGGHDARAFLARQGNAQRTADEAAYVITAALKNARTAYPTVEVDGTEHERPASDWFHIQRRAREIAMDNPGVSGDTAIKAAVEEYDNDHLTIHGRRVPAQGLTQEHQQAIETYVGAIARRMGQRPDSLSAFPLHGNKAQWAVTGEDGFPLSDPETGERVVFSPSTVAGFWRDWKNETEDKRARSRIRLREVNERMGQIRQHAVADDADVQALVDVEAAQGGNLYRYYPQIARDKVRGGVANAARRQILESPEYQQLIQDKYSRTEINGTPLDFLEYLAKQRNTSERQEE